jgi:hypothetical protein
MNDRNERKKRLREKAEESMREAESILEEEIKSLLDATAVELEKLRPNIGDEGTYNQLINAVNEATAKNENLAQLKDRLMRLGTDIIRTAKKAASLLKSF